MCWQRRFQFTENQPWIRTEAIAHCSVFWVIVLKCLLNCLQFVSRPSVLQFFVQSVQRKLWIVTWSNSSRMNPLLFAILSEFPWIFELLLWFLKWRLILLIHKNLLSLFHSFWEAHLSHSCLTYLRYHHTTHWLNVGHLSYSPSSRLTSLLSFTRSVPGSVELKQLHSYLQTEFAWPSTLASSLPWSKQITDQSPLYHAPNLCRVRPLLLRHQTHGLTEVQARTQLI